MTNAWQHGTSPGQLIWAGFEVDRDQLFIAVEDASGTKPVLKDVTDRQECGRGLLLVEQLAHEWGCGPRNGIGKRVWAVIGPRTDEQEPSS